MQPGRMGWAGDVGEEDPLFPMIADAMRQQGQSQVALRQAQSNPMPTKFAALANLASVLTSRYMEHDANQKLRKGQEALVDARQRDLSKIMDSMERYRARTLEPEDGVGPPENRPADKRAMLATLMASRDPMFKAMGQRMIEGEMFPAPPKLTSEDLGDSTVLRDEQGNIVRRMWKGQTPDSAAREKGLGERHATPSGDAIYGGANRREIADADRASRDANAREGREAEERRAAESRALQRELHRTPSGSTIYSQGREDERFGNMPVETSEGFVLRRDAAGKLPYRSTADAFTPNQYITQMRGLYDAKYPKDSMSGARTRGAPSFDDFAKPGGEGEALLRSMGGTRPTGLRAPPASMPHGGSAPAPLHPTTAPPTFQRLPSPGFAAGSNDPLEMQRGTPGQIPPTQGAQMQAAQIKAEAQRAIASGATPEAVRQRIRQLGIDPAALGI